MCYVTQATAPFMYKFYYLQTVTVLVINVNKNINVHLKFLYPVSDRLNPDSDEYTNFTNFTNLVDCKQPTSYSQQERTS